jgi:hypothetical protein
VIELPDIAIGQTLVIDDRSHVVIEVLSSIHYRAMVVPHGGGNPMWLSAQQVRDALARAA